MSGPRAHAIAFLPGLVAVGLLAVWAAHGGGYDPDTWYWGALIALGLLIAVVCSIGIRGWGSSRAQIVALVALASYVAWSYLSITWAASPADALEGSNRALLYLFIFILFTVIPWTSEAALAVMLVFVIAGGVIALVILVRLASASTVGSLFIVGRLAAPTGYFNASAALFMMIALMAVAFATCRKLPILLRGAMLAIAAGGLQLAIIGQSRGWLFTLPLVACAGIAVVRDRLRVTAAAMIPVVAALAPLQQLLEIYRAYGNGQYPGRGLESAAAHAGRVALFAVAAALLAGLLLAFLDRRLRRPRTSARQRRLIGITVAMLAVTAAAGATSVATHGHTLRFVERQWRGFSDPPIAPSSGSHFAQVGSQRYDIWRMAWDATLAHPVGGLGQDNFGDYYVRHRRMSFQEPRWTHSIELRLLAHTGFIGFAIFAAFLAAALSGPLGGIRRKGRRAAFVSSVALLPLIVWLIQGSVDWFWEIPALTGPALGFLGIAIALADAPCCKMPTITHRRRALLRGAGVLAITASLLALGFPYLALRELATASVIWPRNPAAAFRDFDRAAALNPLSPDPGRIGGTIALQLGQYENATKRFAQAISREPGGWFAWLGAGLADSALGHLAAAQHDLVMAAAIDAQQPVVRNALARLTSRHPMTLAEAFSGLRAYQ